MHRVGLAAIAAFGVLSIGSVAISDPAQQPANSPTSTASNTQSDLDQVVCHQGPPPTGTRLGPTRVCHTQREWDRIQHEAEQNLEKMQTQRGTLGPGG